MDSPMLAFFNPVRLDGALGEVNTVDVAAGEEFTIMVTKNKANEVLLIRNAPDLKTDILAFKRSKGN